MTSPGQRVYRQLMHWQRTAMGALPPRAAAMIDRGLPLVVRPMNGQNERQEISRQLAASMPFDRVLETGTYRGGTTQFLADTFRAPVRSVEAVPRYFIYARHRLAGDTRIRLFQGDSRQFLRRQAERAEQRLTNGSPPEAVFFYLDAHWENDLPLSEELLIIADTWDRAVVMIDDFEVPGDPGYGFDDYGPAKALTEHYLPPVVSLWTRLYPVAPSDRESGARRGCVVLISPALADLDVAGLHQGTVS